MDRTAESSLPCSDKTDLWLGKNGRVWWPWLLNSFYQLRVILWEARQLRTLQPMRSPTSTGQVKRVGMGSPTVPSTIVLVCAAACTQSLYSKRTEGAPTERGFRKHAAVKHSSSNVCALLAELSVGPKLSSHNSCVFLPTVKSVVYHTDSPASGNASSPSRSSLSGILKE